MDYKQLLQRLTDSQRAVNSQYWSQYQQRVAALQDKGVEGFFGKKSASWHIYRESLFIFGGARALLLQVAHPAVAQGVHDYSDFERDALGRGVRTFVAMGTIYFGDAAQARAVGMRLHQMHSIIHGEYRNMQDGNDELKPFCANDPDLLLWVLATLTDTSLRIYEAMKGKLSAEIKEQFYEESKITATLMGIPDEVYPKDLAAFNAYFEKTMHDGSLRIDDAGRKVSDAIIYHRYNWTWMTKFLLAGTLPHYLCEGLGVPKSPHAERNYARFLKIVGTFYWLLPTFLRCPPAYYQARHRVARSRKERGSLIGWFWYRVGKRVKLPLGIPVNWK